MRKLNYKNYHNFYINEIKEVIVEPMYSLSQTDVYPSGIFMKPR